MNNIPSIIIILMVFSYALKAQSTHAAAELPIVTFTAPITKNHIESSKHRSSKTEWTYHKTSDELHPNGFEQQMIWLMNRARQNPTKEGVWLANSQISRIENAINFFGVDTRKLEAEFEEILPKPPAVFDNRLYQAAKAHSAYLIEEDAQNHDGQFERVTDNGFVYSGIRGSVFAYGKDAAYSHAAFNIDWGRDSPDGMQNGRGHRKAIMSIDGDYTNIGIAAIEENNPATSVGPMVITANYAKANSNLANHFNTFITGTIWHDDNGNQLYDEGEGIPNITVSTEEGDYFAKATEHGGYAIPVLAADSYTVIFSGGINFKQTVIVEAESILLDIQLCTNQMPCERPTSVVEKIPAHLIEVFPNPVTSHLNINWKGLIEARASIHTISGQSLILNKIIQPQMTKEIPMTNLPKGIYILKIETEKGRRSQQIIKH